MSGAAQNRVHVHRLRQQDLGPKAQAVYLIMTKAVVANAGDANVQIIAAKLTRSAADKQAEMIAGAWVEKIYADK